MEKHQEEFKKMKMALKQEGYREKDVTFTAKKASVMGILKWQRLTGRSF